MTAGEIAGALGGRKSARGWIARCPAHDDRNPSLSLTERDGRLLVHCHAGCSQNAVIEALRERGLWPERERRGLTPAERAAWSRAERQARDLARAAWRWWRERVAELDEAAARAVDLEGGHLDPWALAAAAGEAWRLRSADAAGVIAAYREALETDPEHTLALVRQGGDWDLTAERWCKAVVVALAARQKKGATSHGIAA